MKKKRRLLLIEHLEDRLTPTWGVAWPNATHLTLSFVRDGTDVAGEPSDLFQTMNAIAPMAVWESDILAAFQSWAKNSNINIGVVPDNGQPLGTTGAVQGDSRFGDIRIAARPGTDEMEATTTPFDWTGSTWAGDVVINSNVNYGINGSGIYDLFSVIAHEAGHSFGLPDNQNPASLENQVYTGVQTGPSAADVAVLQSLYGGARQLDVADGDAGNNSLASATNLGSLTTSGFRINGDISNPSDADYFKFTTPGLLGLTGFAVRLQTSGYSLLDPRLTIYNAAGNVVSTQQKVSPLGSDIGVDINVGGLLSLSTYYVRVDPGTSTTFGIGSYHLAIDPVLLGTNVPSLLGTLITDTTDLLFINNPNNHNLLSATLLGLTPSSLTPGDPNPGYTAYFRGNVSQAANVNYYQVNSPAEPAGSTTTLTAMVWAASSGLDPQIHIFDASGNPVLAQVITNTGGTYTLQVQNAAANSTYYVEVTTPNKSTGNYYLAVEDHTTPPVLLQDLGGTTLTGAVPQNIQTMTVGITTLFHFVLGAGSTNSSGNLTLTITNASGNVVTTLTSVVGQPAASLDIYLEAGNYTFTFTAQAQNGTTLTLLCFDLEADVVSDPQGPYSVSTTNTPTSGSGSGGGGSIKYSGSSSTSTSASNGTSTY